MDKVLTWLLFRILLGLVPIGANALRLWTDDLPLDWPSVVGRGELLLVGCAVALGGLGELLGVVDPGQGWVRKVLGFFAVLTVFAGALYYSSISGKLAFQTRYVERSESGAQRMELDQLAQLSRYNKNAVANASLSLYAFSVFTALMCIVYSETTKTQLTNL